MNPKYLNRWQRDGAARVGTGSAGTLPMADDDKKSTAKREKERTPIGFTPRA